VLVVLDGLLAFVERLVDCFDRFRSMPAEVPIRFLEELLGVLQSLYRMIDLGMPLGSMPPRMRIVLSISSGCEDGACAEQHNGRRDDSHDSISSHNLAPYLLAQQDLRSN
jgi:hypothetical protein